MAINFDTDNPDLRRAEEQYANRPSFPVYESQVPPTLTPSVGSVLFAEALSSRGIVPVEVLSGVKTGVVKIAIFPGEPPTEQHQPNENQVPMSFLEKDAATYNGMIKKAEDDTENKSIDGSVNHKVYSDTGLSRGGLDSATSIPSAAQVEREQQIATRMQIFGISRELADFDDYIPAAWYNGDLPKIRQTSQDKIAA